MYRLAIFDFDGTLVDSAPGIIDVMKAVIAEYDLSPEIFDTWSALIGMPLLKQMEIIFPEQTPEYHLTMANRYRAIYDRKAIEICPPFPGLKSLLARLAKARVRIAIASSKRRALIDPVLEFHQLSGFFELVVGQLEVSNHKPHPEPVHHIMAKLEVCYSEAVVIGDSTYDMEMARNAGVDGIGVTTGIHTREHLAAAAPLHIVSGLHEAVPIILNGRVKH